MTVSLKEALEAAGFTVTPISHRQMKIDAKRRRKALAMKEWDKCLKGERRERQYLSRKQRTV